MARGGNSIFFKEKYLFFSMRQDVFDAIVAFDKKNKADLSPEAARFVERLIKLGKRNGKFFCFLFFCIFPTY